MIDELQNTLRTELPVTQHLGVRVISLDPEQVTLAAPLEANRNHAGSAFAGSLNAVATLAGWSWMWALLRAQEVSARVVIQDSSIVYEKPVTSDFQATCRSPEAAAVARFLRAVGRRGRGRLMLQVLVSDAAGAAAAFRGRYVAQRL